MPYAQGRTYYDADSHLMEFSEWLPQYADPAIRDRWYAALWGFGPTAGGVFLSIDGGETWLDNWFMDLTRRQ